MIKYEEVVEQVRIPKIKTCDKCKIEIDYSNMIEWQEFVHIGILGGYGSVFGDGVQVDTDICQNCFKEWVDGFLFE